MISRAASATIKGYYYQFDTTILRLLELNNDNDSVVVEGIEDIDIKTATEFSTVQCKYLSKPKFINSAVRESIILMLDHFIENGSTTKLNYYLYAHFENETPGTKFKIDLERLKDILTYKKNDVSKSYHYDKGISDQQLSSFLSQFNLIFGYEFENQQNIVVNKLQNLFTCTEFEADTYLYNNSLRVVIDKAIIPDVSQRTITKKEFLIRIDCKRKLFNEWYIVLKSKEKYLGFIKRNMQISKALESSREKFILIGQELLLANNSEMPFSSFIENLVHKYYNINNVLRNAKPLTIVLDDKIEKIIEYKKVLINNGIAFNDGYEHIEFSSSMFNEDPIINTTKSRNRISKSSYIVRIISKTTLENNIHTIKTPKVVINFSNNECLYETSTQYQLFDIKYCQNLKDIIIIIG